MVICGACKKHVALTQKVTCVVKDFGTITENKLLNPTGADSVNFTQSLNLCPDCISLVNQNEFLEVHKDISETKKSKKSK